MKRNLLITCTLAGALLFSGCVSKQKYVELENKYKDCSDNLTFTTAEKIDYENAKKQLEQQVSTLKSKVNKLSDDTLTLSKRLNQSEKDLAKAYNDYDELLKQFTDLNRTSSTEVDKLLKDIEKIKGQLTDREKELNSQRDELNLAAIELSDKESQLADLQRILEQKDAEVKALKDKVTDALKGFEQSGLNIYEKDGKVYVSMEDKLLFASGSWVLNSEGLTAINKLAKVLEADQSFSILIEGHTDNVPFKGNGQVKDNWDLSVMRATAVVKALLKNSTIDPSRLSASGRSEYCPVENENTSAARAKNRRTEIILAPKLDELYSIINKN